MKIVFLDQSHLQRSEETFDYSKLERLGNFSRSDVTESEEILRVARDSEVVITGKLSLTEEIFSQLPALKLVVKAGTGVDKFDLNSARKHNISIVNIPGYGASSVAQYTVALLLSLAGSVVPYNREVKVGAWAQSQFKFPVREFRNKTLGIIGLGGISRAVLEMLSPFQLQMLVNTSYPDKNLDVEYVQLSELAERSDFVSVHCLLNQKTRGLISKELLDRMKSSCLLVNTARPGIINEKDLIEAIKGGRIGGVAMDGFWREPAEENHPLYSHDNVIITPHIAWAPYETRQEMISEIADVINAFFKGNPRNVVN